MLTILETLFPGLRGTPYLLTSPVERRYNCVAWAAGFSDDWWWPGPEATTYWPPGAPREETLDAFESAFAKFGYESCATGNPELGFEKVAIFADSDGVPTHAARSLPNGRWTSKLGRREDIEHELSAIAGDSYGSPARFMKRAFKDTGIPGAS
jgi:hypothetical protein